ncbi:MAG TPA: hypothetical protein VFH62_07150, partial [Dehalococcoidia bacterium]|nr:hypothetical protein [Dehalococcoidia bacterium]
ACMGSPIEGEGLIPLGVQVTGPNTNCFDFDPNDPDHDAPPDTELPQFGQFCQLAFAGENLGSGEGGFLRLFDDGSSQCSTTNISGEDTGGPGRLLRDEIADGGANTTCYVAPPGASCDGVPDDWPYGDVVNYCVWPKTQTFNNPTQNAFTTMLEGEGECDALFGNGDGTDDWLEVVEAVDGDPSPSPTTTFARRACKSPRLINLIIIKQFCDGVDCNGNAPQPILAFASFYIQSCKVTEKSTGTEYEFPDCDIKGVGSIGQAGLYGFFMNVLNIGTIGAYNGYGQRSLALWE